ncbi:TolA protein [Mariniphaga anaerophila]|uniref:TolA protein n=1 Tax=Mariniphaga anaerophila TaxID=1484053 RepID=A0A1M4SYC4_9BACT|nr:cell envelope integrity protein TolA [Mariniphaga anaerophila]SHE37007.1 TolA protein [Mariniphaga anaerophila]
MTYFEQHKKGIIGTAVFHIIVLLLLIFMGFFTPLPLPGEEGILVNFGTSNQGLGDVEPSPQRRQPDPPPPTRSEPEPATPPPPVPAATPPAAQPKPAEEVAMTQDYEETAAIDAAEKKRQEEAERQRKLEEQRRREQQLAQQKEAEAERQRKAEIERQRQVELERQKQAELERQRQAELERQKHEEEQRRIAEINSRAQGAFGGGNSGTEGQGTGASQSQGATFPGGNQGVPTGDPNAGTYGPGGSGSGNQGSGISYSLAGRSARSLPKPVYPGNDEGVVVVKVTVDKNGNVTAAEPGSRGTTIMDQRFWNEARQAALKAKFNVAESAPAFQQGTISYRFRLN